MIARIRCIIVAAVAMLLSTIAVAVQADTTHGTWNIYRESDALMIDMHWHSADGSSSENHDAQVDAQALGITEALASSGRHGSFTMHRNAGDFAFDGWFANGEASGTYTFNSNESFFDALRKRGYDVQAIDRQMGFALVDMTLAYVDAISAELAKSGNGQLDAHNLIALKGVGVTPEYIEDIANNGYPHLTAREYVAFKAMKIDGAYLRKLADRGFKNLPPRKVIAIKAMGIL